MSVVYVVHKIYIVGEHPTLSRLLWAKFLVGKAPVDRVCIGPNSLIMFSHITRKGLHVA